MALAQTIVELTQENARLRKELAEYQGQMPEVIATAMRLKRDYTLLKVATSNLIRSIVPLMDTSSQNVFDPINVSNAIADCYYVLEGGAESARPMVGEKKNET